MAEPLPKPWTLDDFLAWEEQQPERFEFVDGVVRMMVGGTLAHNRITVNLVTALHVALRGSNCQAFSSDVRVVSRARSESTYPDVMATCGPVEMRETKVDEPLLVAEVLSRSTADRDRGAKFETYKAITSLRVYLLVSQDDRVVDVFRRTNEGWTLTRISGDGEVSLPELDCRLPLASIYEGVPI